jgi:hypothetical protein
MANLGNVVELIQVADALAEKAAAALREKEAQDAAVTRLIPFAVESLLAHERIRPADREKAAADLRNPVRMLEILIKAADPTERVGPSPIGSAVVDKKASAGGSAGPREAESDRVWNQGFGIG